MPGGDRAHALKSWATRRRKYGKRGGNLPPKPIEETSKRGKDERFSHYWHVKRADIIAARGARCVDCGSTKRIQVDCVNGDHFDANPDNFAVVCQSCNMKRGHRRGEFAKLQPYYNRNRTGVAGLPPQLHR